MVWPATFIDEQRVKKKRHTYVYLFFWRRERDSNPRTGISRYTISNRAPSTSSAISPYIFCFVVAPLTTKVIISDNLKKSTLFLKKI